MTSDSLVHAYSGALGGIYPLISISTRAQVEARRHPGESSLEAALHLIKREGFRSLYDGLGSSLIGIAVTNGIYYLFFEEARSILLLRSSRPSRKSLSTIESMISGAVAGTMTAVLTNPIWVVNTRQTVRVIRPQLPNQSCLSSSTGSLPTTSNTSKTSANTITPNSSSTSTSNTITRSKRMGFLQTVLFILRTDGPMALFRGLGPALILVINPILQYTLFEQMKNILIANRAKNFKLSSSSISATKILKAASGSSQAGLKGSSGHLDNGVEGYRNLRDLDFFILGAISKLFATGSTYPYLTVKSRMQSGQAEGRSYKNTFDGLRKIIKKDGVSGLYRGIGPKLTQSVLTAAFLFLAKERIYIATKRMLKTAEKIKPIAT
ncbi:peroxisomal membrane protein PMP47B [Phakopsora pachyrhizi]|nr:peroxisomal membrane protein PMP47B [Phakopsora pachyrhizi]